MTRKPHPTAKPGIPLTVPYTRPQPGMLKIGEVAEELGVSVQSIRLYETEGLLISFRSPKGTRWYSREDIAWIEKIRDLLSEGLNFAGIRRLLALIPCWALKPCRPEERAACSMRHEVRMPCWVVPEKLCTEKLKECYHCKAYRKAKDYVSLKTEADIVPLKT